MNKAIEIRAQKIIQGLECVMSFIDCCRADSLLMLHMRWIEFAIDGDTGNPIYRAHGDSYWGFKDVERYRPFAGHVVRLRHLRCLSARAPAGHTGPDRNAFRTKDLLRVSLHRPSIHTHCDHVDTNIKLGAFYHRAVNRMIN